MARTRSKSRQKPSKPYPSYPLTAHNNGQWCKKIRGKIHFFGTWDDPRAALEKYLAVAPDLHAGRQPRQPSVSADEIRVKEVCNQFLTHQLQKEESGQITVRWFEDCRRVAEHFVRTVGSERAVSDLRPKDFLSYRWALINRGLVGQKGLGVHALTRAVTIVRGMFKHAYEIDLLDRPMKYGGALDRPSARVRRKEQHAARIANGKRIFEPYQARGLISEAGMPLRAMILLGLNGGFGNTDCAQLPRQAVDFNKAVIEFDRPKTGIERLVPLWPETIDALQEAMGSRPQPYSPQAEELVFLTPTGRPWIRARLHATEGPGARRAVNVDVVSCQFDKLLRKLNLKRKGLGFYALRHTFRTWADEVNDQHAIHRIMGHVVPGMSGIYVQEIGLDRLRRVVEHVRKKLFEQE